MLEVLGSSAKSEIYQCLWRIALILVTRLPLLDRFVDCNQIVTMTAISVHCHWLYTVRAVCTCRFLAKLPSERLLMSSRNTKLMANSALPGVSSQHWVMWGSENTQFQPMLARSSQRMNATPLWHKLSALHKPQTEIHRFSLAISVVVLDQSSSFGTWGAPRSQLARKVVGTVRESKIFTPGGANIG